MQKPLKVNLNIANTEIYVQNTNLKNLEICTVDNTKVTYMRELTSDYMCMLVDKLQTATFSTYFFLVSLVLQTARGNLLWNEQLILID